MLVRIGGHWKRAHRVCAHEPFVGASTSWVSVCSRCYASKRSAYALCHAYNSAYIPPPWVDCNDLGRRQILTCCTMECTTRWARWLWRVSFSAVFRTICRTSDAFLNHCCLRRPSLSYHHCLHCKMIRSSLHPASVFVIVNNPESLSRKAKPHPHLQFPTCTFGVKLF